MKEQWNKDIRDRLKDFPKKAPEGLLDDIKAEMAHRGLSPTLVPRKSKHVLLRIASVAAVLFILLGISHLWEEQPIGHPVGNIVIPRTDESTLPIFAKKGEQEVVSATTFTPKVIAPIRQPSASRPDTLKTGKDNAKKAAEKEAQEEKQDKIKEQQATPTRKGRKKIFTPTRRKGASFAIGAYYSGLVAQTDIEFNELTDLAPSTDFFPLFPNDNNSSDSTAVSSRAFSRSRTATNGVKHHLPVRVGVSFRYYLSKHWNIQSGLTYSYLATDINRNAYQKKQALHYIGIPIQIGYQIWENKLFKSYISAGAQVEKLVSGKATTHYIGSNTLQDTSTEDIRDKHPLFSTLASIGAEYALTPSLSIYAEPGIHYYFDNGNGLETHYNDQPLNFNITVGFRFHWKR